MITELDLIKIKEWLSNGGDKELQKILDTESDTEKYIKTMSDIWKIEKNMKEINSNWV